MRIFLWRLPTFVIWDFASLNFYLILRFVNVCRTLERHRAINSLSPPLWMHFVTLIQWGNWKYTCHVNCHCLERMRARGQRVKMCSGALQVLQESLMCACHSVAIRGCWKTGRRASPWPSPFLRVHSSAWSAKRRNTLRDAATPVGMN